MGSRRFFVLFILAWVFSLQGCDFGVATKSQSHAAFSKIVDSNHTESIPELITFIQLKSATDAFEVFSLIDSSDGMTPDMSIVVVHPFNCQSIWRIEKTDTNSAVERLYQVERQQLLFLASNFDVNDPLEGPVYNDLMENYSRVVAEHTVRIQLVRISGRFDVPENDLFEKVVTIERHDFASGLGSLESRLTDYTNDASYVPAGGASMIGVSGSLQKFWLDDSAKNALNGSKDGLEIDTIISPKKAATCGSSGVSSNMPGFYKDTEAFDLFTSGDVRNCAVGTINAAALKTWTLYWTWHPFSSYDKNQNPKASIQYQPNKWCPWVLTSSQCKGNPPWCMCSRKDMPIEWLITYNYNEAADKEVQWFKN